jgi:cytochrome c-type biogenesis protein CcmH
LKLRSAGPWIVLGLVVVVAVAVAAWPRGGPESVTDHTRRLAAEIRCVDCEGLSVADSSTQTAREQRRDIAQRIRAGESDGDIRRVYVDRYGESVLLKPTNTGVGVLVWSLPVIALILGAGGIVLALRRWQRQPRLVATEADEELVEQLRHEQ